MPHVIRSSPSLAAHGAVVSVRVEIPRVERDLRTMLGRPIPPALHFQALIDTGATHSVVRAGTAVHLGLHPSDVTLVHTASQADLLYPRYPIRLVFENNVSFETTVLEAPPENKYIECLIGRNILEHAILVYNGPGHLFSLSF